MLSATHSEEQDSRQCSVSRTKAGKLYISLKRLLFRAKGDSGNRSKDTGLPKAKPSHWPNFGLCEHQSRNEKQSSLTAAMEQEFCPAHEPKGVREG